MFMVVCSIVVYTYGLRFDNDMIDYITKFYKSYCQCYGWYGWRFDSSIVFVLTKIEVIAQKNTADVIKTYHVY